MSQPIIVAECDIRARERMLKKYGASLFRDGPRFVKSIAIKDDADAEPLICLEGLCVLFDTPILNQHCDTIVFEPKAFDKYFESGKLPAFWLRHDSTKVVGANVELCILNEGVAFRFPPANTSYAATIKEMVKSGAQDSISIGYKELKTRNEICFGHPVRFIVEADLVEVSAVPVGACKQAFSRLIDANREPPLHESVNTSMFAIEWGMHNVKVIRKENEADIDRLERRLSALQDGMYDDEPHLIELSMTSDQSNRFVTETYDSMISARRTMLCM